MTDEDYTAAKLQGYTSYIKFVDGEEVLLKNDFVDDLEMNEWFSYADRFLNDKEGPDSLRVEGFAISRNTVKYISKI